MSPKKQPAPNLEGIEVHEDGTRHLVHPEVSPIKQKILDSQEDWQKQQADLHEVKIRRVEYKRATQERNGWPSDKSPV